MSDIETWHERHRWATAQGLMWRKAAEQARIDLATPHDPPEPPAPWWAEKEWRP